MRNSRLMKSVSIGAMMAAMVTPALAQPDSEPGEDKIIVTATRRAETVQDVPINIAAVGGEQIEQQGFDELSDVLSYVPGINIVDRGGRQGNPIIVRGLNVDSLGSGDGNNDGGGTVATYLGEIPIYLDLKLNDLERVEVLLGPQGTLYGAGTLGGAIRYIPTKPQFGEATVSVRGETYKYSEAADFSTDLGFTFNTSITDTFAIRGSFDWRDDSGFIDYDYVVREPGVSEPDPDYSDLDEVAANFDPIEDANSEETYSGRIAARWMPVDAVDATLTYYFQNTDIGGRQISSAGVDALDAGDYVSAKRVEEPNQIKNELLALEVVADLGFAELTSATGFSKFEDDGQRDQTDLLITLEYSYETFPTFTAFTREKGEEERFNQEVRLVSTWDRPYNWIIGGFYNELETASFSAEYTPGYADFAGFDRPDDLEYFSQFHSKLEESAIFGEVSLELFERLTLTAGGRYYDYEYETYDAVDFPLFDPGFVAPTVDQIKDFDTSPNQSDSGTLYKFNASYEVNTDLLVYATVSEGYRIGASNGVGTCPEYDPDDNQQGACALLPGQRFGPGPDDISNRDETSFGPDQTTNYEVGVKSQWLDGTVTLNGAVFFVDWVDPQVSSATVNASIPITVNADGAESKGIELSGAWQPIPELNIRGSYSHTETELTAPVPDLVRSITPPGFGTAFTDGESGDRLPGSPEDQFSVFASYEQAVSEGRSLTYNFGYAWQGDVLTTTAGKGGGFALDSFGLANASVVYDAGQWKGTLFVNNVFDEYAETGAIGNPLYNQVIEDSVVRTYAKHIAAPRAIGIRFTYDFDLSE